MTEINECEGMQKMSPLCKWKPSSLVSNTQLLTGALLETSVKHLFLSHVFFSKKGMEQRWDFLCVLD